MKLDVLRRFVPENNRRSWNIALRRSRTAAGFAARQNTNDWESETSRERNEQGVAGKRRRKH